MRTKRFLKDASSPLTASWLCWALAVFAIALAFVGSERSSLFMGQPSMSGIVALLAILLLYTGLRAIKRRRYDSLLLHLGCTLILAGWVWGRLSEGTLASQHPAVGSMALVNGEESDKLWSGTHLDQPLGTIPFKVRLESFMVERYGRSAHDRLAGREAPVKEYRSRVTITHPGCDPYVANIRVNHPLRVAGYHIYQMSWGQTHDRLGRPMLYTVLNFRRDPGLHLVYAGFIALFLGNCLFALRVLMTTSPAAATVQQGVLQENA